MNNKFSFFKVFHEIAYKASKREHIIAGIDEFLDSVTVLPPGEWDPSIRIEPPDHLPSQEGRRNYGQNGTAVCDNKVHKIVSFHLSLPAVVRAHYCLFSSLWLEISIVFYRFE